MPLAQTGAQFEAAVIELAQVYQWRVAHFRPAKTEKGWRTPVSADGKGFPDLLLLRADRQLVVELKTGRGKLTPEQVDWIEAFAAAGVETRLWRPEDWPEIDATLRLLRG
jgi:hypothetical protein